MRNDFRVGRWFDERIDLARVYAEIWKDAAPAHLVDVAVFCDSDDTHTASVRYFAYVRQLSYITRQRASDRTSCCSTLANQTQLTLYPRHLLAELLPHATPFLG
jgi:hypothetical protein